MRIGLISDTHGNLDGWQQAWDLVLKDADIIIHCGDVLYHGPKFTPAPGYAPQKLAQAINEVSVPVLIARGNGDSQVDQLVLDVPLQQPHLLVQWEGMRLLATHGHLLPTDEIVELGQKWSIDHLITGHSHVPAVEQLGEVVHVNPGTVTYPLAEEENLQRLTCGVITDEGVQILDIVRGEELDLCY